MQMIRNTMEAYCTDVNVPFEPAVHQYKTLQHLYTPVRAKLKKTIVFFHYQRSASDACSWRNAETGSVSVYPGK